MSNQQELIEKLKEQIAFLTSELERAEKKSDSLWSNIHDAFIDEGNEGEQAEFWADRISELVSSWVAKQRDSLGRRIVATGAMPPYTDCLNDLIVSISPPGSAPPALPEEFAQMAGAPVVGPTLPTTSLPPPVTYNGLSADAQLGPAKMQRVNVPKPFPGAVPLALPPETKEPLS